jgi:hypothetical protein
VNESVSKAKGPSSHAVVTIKYSPITYYYTGFLILNHSYLVGNFLKIAETKAL